MLPCPRGRLFFELAHKLHEGFRQSGVTTCAMGREALHLLLLLLLREGAKADAHLGAFGLLQGGE